MFVGMSMPLPDREYAIGLRDGTHPVRSDDHDSGTTTRPLRWAMRVLVDPWHFPLGAGFEQLLECPPLLLRLPLSQRDNLRANCCPLSSPKYNDYDRRSVLALLYDDYNHDGQSLR